LEQDVGAGAVLVVVEDGKSPDGLTRALRRRKKRAVALHRALNAGDWAYDNFLHKLRGEGTEVEAEVGAEGAAVGACVVATAETLRGMDIPGLARVLLLRTPKDANTYLHLAGRTGRRQKGGAGEEGLSGEVTTLVQSEYEMKRLTRYASSLSTSFQLHPNSPAAAAAAAAARGDDGMSGSSSSSDADEDGTSDRDSHQDGFPLKITG
jgi:superfamily II DNA/RNA helicase